MSAIINTSCALKLPGCHSYSYCKKHNTAKWFIPTQLSLTLMSTITNYYVSTKAHINTCTPQVTLNMYCISLPPNKAATTVCMTVLCLSWVWGDGFVGGVFLCSLIYSDRTFSTGRLHNRLSLRAGLDCLSMQSWFIMLCGEDGRHR